MPGEHIGAARRAIEVLIDRYTALAARAGARGRGFVRWADRHCTEDCSLSVTVEFIAYFKVLSCARQIPEVGFYLVVVDND